MAAGPLFPSSAIPADNTGRVFPHVHVGMGPGAKKDEGLGVMVSLDADAAYDLKFQIPPALPTGTGKLRLLAISAATAGEMDVEVSWLSIAVGEDPSAGPLSSEGVFTFSWDSGTDDNIYLEQKVTLDADTLVAGEIVAMQLDFQVPAGGSIIKIGTFSPSIIWE